MPKKSSNTERFRMDSIPVVLHRKAGRTVWSAKITLPSLDGATHGKDGNRVDRGTGETELDKAQAAAHRIYAQLTNKVERGESISSKPFSAVADEYLHVLDEGRKKGSVRLSAINRTSTALSRYYKPFFLDRDIASITYLDLARHHGWRMEYADHHNGDETISYVRKGKIVQRPFKPTNPSVEALRKERSIFYKLMEYAWKQGYIQREAIPKYDKLKGHSDNRSALTQDEMEHIQRVSAGRILETNHKKHKRQRILVHYRMLFIYLTGCRPQEIAQLTFGDLVPGVDKAGEQSWMIDLKTHHLKNPENKVHKRKVTPQRGFALLIHSLKAFYQEFDGRTVTDDDFIFQNQDGTVVKKVNKTMKSLFLAAGLRGKGYSQYTYRHSFISERLYERQDAHFISRWVGTSLAMIDRHYAHVSQELEHQQNAPAENTVILEPFSLDYFMGRKTADPERPPTIWDMADEAGERLKAEREAQRQFYNQVAQEIIDGYDGDPSDIYLEEAEELADEQTSNIAGQKVDVGEIADLVMQKTGKELVWKS